MRISDRLKSPMVANFLSLAFLQGVNYVLPLLSFPYLFRVLGVERWGLVAFGFSLMQYFVMFTDFGFNLSATKYISENRQDTAKINAYLNSAMTGRFVLCGLSLLVLLVLIGCVGPFKAEPVFYLLYFGMILGNVMFPLWFFQGMENMKYITLFNILAKAISILPLFLFVRGPEQYIYVPVCYSLGFVLAGVVSLYIVYRKMGMSWYVTPMAETWEVLRNSGTFFLSRLSVSLFTTSNSFLIGLVCGNTAVGYYSAAEKLYQAYNQLLTPFTGVLFPHIAKSRDTVFFQKVFYRITVANLFSVSAVLLLGGFILRFVYGSADPAILEIFDIVLCASFVAIPSILLGYPFLAAMGHPKYTNWTVILTSVFHIAGLGFLYLNGWLVPVTVAGLVVLSETMLCGLRVFGVRKYGLFGKQVARPQ